MGWPEEPIGGSVTETFLPGLTGTRFARRRNLRKQEVPGPHYPCAPEELRLSAALRGAHALTRRATSAQ